MIKQPKNRLTKQRKHILDVVKSVCYHPTAHQIHKLVIRKLPKISFGTVYRNLDVLSSQNLIRRIDIPGEPARFDADIGSKAYFICKNKGTIYDLKIDKAELDKILSDQPVVEKTDSFSLVVFGKSKSGHDDLTRRKGRLKK